MEVDVYPTLSLTSVLDWVGGQHQAPVAPPAGKRPGTHFTVGQVDAYRRSSKGADKLAPSGFDPRTVRPVASGYTNYSIPVHFKSTLVLRIDEGKE